MKIAVVGTGAMGSVYAALLADAGNEVWAVDTWAEHIEAIKANGLRVEGASGDRTVRLNATGDPAEVGLCDLVVIATKAQDVAAAATSATVMLGNHTLILTIQNGVGAPERISAAIQSDNILNGIAGGFGASMVGPGHAHHNDMQLIALAEFAGPVTLRLERVAKAWSEAGFNVRACDDVTQMVWEKLICNVAYSGPCTVSRRTIGQVQGSARMWQVSSGCATEAFEVARAQGITLSFDDPVAHVRAFGAKMPHARPSMLLDHLAGRRSEVDAINGAIPEIGANFGVPTPYNEVVSALVRALEEGFG
jgi:2-dehydropantoate 2-reductase